MEYKNIMEMMMKLLNRTALAVAALLTPVAATQAAVSLQSLSDTEFAFGGYVKADLMVSNYSEGAPDDNNISRQFYVPGAIYGDSSRGKSVTDFHARETRFNFAATNEIDGHKLKFFVEMDFLTHTDGNERVSNSYSPRLRHAFVSVDNWLVGQTWTTFQDVGALPEALDFVGAAEGTTFARQGQIRYTNGGWQFALENPSSTFTDYTTGVRKTGSSDLIPDLIARYNFKTGSSKFMLAALLRELEYEEENMDESTFGWALSGSGVIPVGSGRDTFKFMANVGEGAGRYMALNFVNGAVLGNGEVEAITTYSGFASYQHWWDEKWRSNITASALEADYDTSPVAAVNETSYSGNINLLYSPVKPITVGVEYLYALNERTDGTDADLSRFMFSLKYVL
nr:DcaP family trimeric outer membrane transporter [Ferrimonas sediminum]